MASDPETAARPEPGTARIAPSAAKLRLPGPPGWDMPRPGLQRRLDGILSHRLTTVVGGAGFGKSTALAAWARKHPVAWYALDSADRRPLNLAAGLITALRPVRAEAAEKLTATLLRGQGAEDETDETERARSLASVIGDALAEQPGSNLALVLDDLDQIDATGPAVRFVEALVRAVPADVHVVLASRRPVPFPVDRLRGQGQLLDIDDRVLSFSATEAETLLERIAGEDASALGSVVHAATDGWPAAVILVAQALHETPADERASTLRRLQRPEGPLFAYVAGEALAHETPATIDWLRVAAQFERFSTELLEAANPATLPGSLAAGERPSVFLHLVADEPGWYRLHGLIREYILSKLPVPEAELTALRRRAAAWFEAQGMIDEALQAHAVVGDTTAVRRLLRDRGSALLEQGSIDRIVSAEEALSDDLRGPGSERLYGDALLARGEWTGAMAAYARAAGGREAVEPGLAWRVGLMHYLRGDLESAARTFDRAHLDGSAPADEALVLAWSASVQWLFGDPEGTRGPAARSLEIATRIGDERALAAAYMATALVAILDGDLPSSEAAHRAALGHAERSGDVLQLVRVRDNLGDHMLEQGRYAEALSELDGAVRLAEAVGFPAYQALALANRGQAQLELGHFDEAISDFRASRAIYQRLGSGWVAYAIVREANVHRLRGDLALARAAYEDAIRTSTVSGDRQILVPALVGLALTVVGDEPDHARALVAAALQDGHGAVPLVALVGGAIISLRVGELDAAVAQADAAIEAGRMRRDRPNVARALQVRAEAGARLGRPTALADLDQARAIWVDCGSPTGEALNLLHRARVLTGADRAEAARDAERRFVALGARGWAAEARTMAELAEIAPRPPVAIEALGAFRVIRNGQVVPITDWQSKKARDLLKMLVARRGRPAAREGLIESLWPDQDPGPLGNRFSVALTTVRTVLDPDRAFGPDHFVTADKNTVALDMDHVELDLVRFLGEVEEGRRLERADRPEEAADHFRAAVATYGGDFLEEDQFEDWAAGVRDEAQAAYLSVVRVLAERAAMARDDAAATGLFLRILERDPFDEPAHLGLVEVLLAAGRHGEARRRYGTYQARMDEIAVEAAPFPVAPPRDRGAGELQPA